MFSSAKVLAMGNDSAYSFSVKVHTSDALGLGMIATAIWSQWLLLGAILVVWALLYLIFWGRSVWANSPVMLIYLLAVPLLFAPSVILRHTMPELVPYSAVMALIGWIALSMYMLPKVKRRLGVGD